MRAKGLILLSLLALWTGIVFHGIFTPTEACALVELEEINFFETDAQIGDLALRGSYAYLAEAVKGMGFRAVDISDPNSPRTTGSVERLLYWPTAISLTPLDHYAVLLEYGGRVRIVDLFYPGNPVENGHLYTGLWAIDVAASERYAYIADPASGIVVLNIEDRMKPLLVKTVANPSGGNAYGIAVSGNRLYLAAGDEGLIIYDLSGDPETPAPMGQAYCLGSNDAIKVAVAGQYAYVANELEGLDIFDIQNPASPYRVSSVSLEKVLDKANNISLSGRYAYLSAGDGKRVYVIDVNDPGSPEKIAVCETDDRVTAACGNDNHIFVGTNRGMSIFRLMTEAYIPHLTTGSSEWLDQLQVDNLAASSARYHLTLYDDTGEICFENEYAADPFSYTTLSLKQLHGSAHCGKITFIDNHLKFRMLYINQVGNSVAEFNLSDQKTNKLAFLFANAAPFVQAKIIALMNPTNETVILDLFAFGQGEIKDSVSVELPARTRIIGNILNWFTGLDLGAIEKVLAITQDSSKSILGLAVSSDSGGISDQMLFIPAIPAKFIP